MTRRARLDAELVRRGLARSREQAAELVAAGQVSVPGRTSVKAATQVAVGDPIVVAEPAGETYVSRGGHKLAGALDAFATDGLDVAGRRALDAGASTGGFTDVLLRRGAREVVCVDVGLRPARLAAADRRPGPRAGPDQRARPDRGRAR